MSSLTDGDLAGLVDLEALQEWMSGQTLGNGRIDRVSRVGGGTQNVMLRFTRAGREYVLRRGPRHLRTNSNRVIRRETEVLAALAGTDVPHPRLIASCQDEEVLGGAAFYLMEPIDGFNAALELPDLHAQEEAVRHAMGLALVDAIVALGSVDHRAVGLADLGNPDGFLERQVPRWLDELESYRTRYGHTDTLPDVAEIGRWLRSRVPRSRQTGLMHGDYHMANVMFSRTGPEVVAVVDWEMCTVGDPLLDLGWLLATWRLPDPPSILGGPYMSSSGLPSHAELVARYAAGSVRDVSEVGWYTVLACFKLAILLEGTWARALAGRAPVEVGEALHQAALRLLERGRTHIEDER